MAKKTQTAPKEARVGLHVVTFESENAPACHRWMAFAYRFAAPGEDGGERVSSPLVYVMGATEDIVREKTQVFIDREKEKAARRRAAVEASKVRLREMQRTRRERVLEDA